MLSTNGEVHPIVCPPYGWIPYVIPIITPTRPNANVAFPHQSIRAGRRIPSSRSER